MMKHKSVVLFVRLNHVFNPHQGHAYWFQEGGGERRQLEREQGLVAFQRCSPEGSTRSPGVRPDQAQNLTPSGIQMMLQQSHTGQSPNPCFWTGKPLATLRKKWPISEIEEILQILTLYALQIQNESRII